MHPSNRTLLNNPSTPHTIRQEYEKNYRHFIKALLNDPAEAPDKPDKPFFMLTPALQPGAMVEQFIVYDPYPNLWNAERTTVVDVHLVEAKRWKDIIELDATEAPARRPLDPLPVIGEEGEVDAYRDTDDATDEDLDEPIESKSFLAVCLS